MRQDFGRVVVWAVPVEKIDDVREAVNAALRSEPRIEPNSVDLIKINAGINLRQVFAVNREHQDFTFFDAARSATMRISEAILELTGLRLKVNVQHLGSDGHL